MHKLVDLRSDTMTKPTQAMRDAMYRAETGNAGYGEDPTVNRLEKMAAERMGKEAALFVPSGTMGNLVSLLSHCQRGDEVILGNLSHIFLHEQGGMASVGGIHNRALANLPDGTLALCDVEAAIRPHAPYYPVTRLICLENSHSLCGGTVLCPDYMASVRALAQRHGLAIHLDGERIFNAAVALNVDVRLLTKDVDSVMFGLSKGLSAPIGSLVCGSHEFIAQARRSCQVLGGTMRQAGVIAAAGIVALDEMVDRLVEDHRHARQLAEALCGYGIIRLDPKTVQTNIVIFTLADERLALDELAAALEREGVLLEVEEGYLVRLVTHCWIEDEDIELTLAAFERVLRRYN